MNRTLNVFVILCMFLALNTYSVSATVNAVETPSFPQCPNPGGTVIAQYDSGVHGVPGDSTTYTGKDSVFKLDDAKVVQCLCPDSGSGVQTLWWKNPGLSSADEKKVISEGWVRVPNGALWGLDQGSYFAKSSNYTCKETPSSTPNPSTSPSEDNKPGSNNTSSNSSSGAILGASTLANTGNLMAVVGLFFLAAGALAAGVFTRRASR